MALDTYDNLKLAIAGWLEDEDLDDYIDDFIDHAEDEMYANLRIRELLVHDTAFTISDGDRYEALPSDPPFLDVKYLRIQRPTSEVGSGRFYPPLRQLTIDQMTERSMNLERRPHAFCLHTQFEFDFEADQDYTGELFYYQKFERLSDSNASNEVLAAYPSLYLNGALGAASKFLEHDSRIATFKQDFYGLMVKLNEKNVQNQAGGPMVATVAGLPRRA